MREHRYRAFYKNNQKMYQVLTLDIIDKKALIEWHGKTDNDYLRGYAPLDDIVLMQYTGLKDKNGREIYEGDILLQKTTPQFKKYNPCQWERRYIVKFGYHEVMPHHADGVALGWTLVEVVRGYRKAIGDLEIDNQTGNYPYEIIGNIYENPELLEAEK